MDEIKIENQEPKKKNILVQLALPISILAAALIISGTILYTRSSKTDGGTTKDANDQPAANQLEINSADRIIGNPNAKVAIFEFSDFQCPYCRRFFEDAYTQIKKEYIDTGKAKIVFRHFPLTSIHPMALPAANAVECAADQGKFEAMHDKIFSEQAKLGNGTVQFAISDLKSWARAAGLNAGTFNQCLDSGKYSQKISNDQKIASQVGVTGTPTFIINGQTIIGAQPFESFKVVIDAALK